MSIMFEDQIKNHRFKQVNNSELNQMNYNLWHRASLDATSSNNSTASDSPVHNNLIDLFSDLDTPPSSTNKPDDIGCLKQFSDNYPVKKDDDDNFRQDVWVSPSSASPIESVDLTPLFPNNCQLSPVLNRNIVSDLQSFIVDNLCTLHMDMTLDDRIFFGVHNFHQLKRSLSEYQCNIDFSAHDNKVSLIGKIGNVQKMSEMFISNSTLALQFEFKILNEKYLDYLKNVFNLFHKQCETFFKVFVTYRRTKPNIVLFHFLSFRNNGMGLLQAMFQLKTELEVSNIAELIPTITSTMQIPANRRDLIGRSNSYIEQIQTQTNTKIEVIRYEECPQYPFENVIIEGNSIIQVIQARFELVSRFVYELKFQVAVKENRPLVEYISKLSNDLKSVYISIEPCHNAGSYSKNIAIHGNEKSLGKLFMLRNQLIDEVKKCNGNVGGGGSTR